MAIIKKQNTMLFKQAQNLKENINNNNSCLAKELEPLLIKEDTYNLEYKLQRDAAKERNKIKINILTFLIFIIITLACYHFLKIILIDAIFAFAISSQFKASSYEKITSKIQPNKELEKIEIEICEIENRYKNENYVIQENLDKIQKGLNGEISVSSLIEKHLTDKFILLNDIVIPGSRSTTQIDHILITPMKIICIETKSSEGIYYPNKDGWMWYPTDRQKYGRSAKGVLQPNPSKQSIYHADSLMNFLNENQFECKIESIVVLSNKYSEFKGDNRFCKIIHIDELISYLRLDCNKGYAINSNEANAISELLLKSNEKLSGKHYGKYSVNNFNRIQI